MAIETQIRCAIRDAVNRHSRKPFHWGGLAGYQQLEAIAQALHRVVDTSLETIYLRQLSEQVDRVLEKNQALVLDLQGAHHWLRQIAACLRYPPRADADREPDAEAVTSQQIAQEVETILQQFHPDTKRQRAQMALCDKLRRLWRKYGTELLHCYDIPGLSPDNLQMESLFNRLRRHQRRVSGRKSTRELRYLGQYQVLFVAESEGDLLAQLRQVPLADYQRYRRRLSETESHRQFLHRLHRDPVSAMQRLVAQHIARQFELAQISVPADVLTHHNV